MARKHKPEEIIGKLREAEIVLAQGGTVADACWRIGVTEQSYYRWRKEYGGWRRSRDGPARTSARPCRDPRGDPKAMMHKSQILHRVGNGGNPRSFLMQKSDAESFHDLWLRARLD